MPPRTRQPRRPSTTPLHEDRKPGTPGLSQPKCAKLLGISVRAVQDREYRALGKLRAAIESDRKLLEAMQLEIG